uniref:Uncharacterized protein n=1 Tax=viral metagenome TaxID=1070528 RepID=A0A6M3IIH4_9ZZZZ
MRYIDGGIEGVDGYTKVSTSVINASYNLARSGYHFLKDRPFESHILAQVYDGLLYRSRIYESRVSPPGVGNFESVALHDDASYSELVGNYGQNTVFADTTQTAFADTPQTTSPQGTLWADVSTLSTLEAVDTPRARFCPAPNSQIIYSNGVESQIWAGDEAKLAVFVVSTSAVTDYLTNGKYYTEKVNNEYADSANVVTLSGSGGTVYWLTASTRPISGASFYVSAANTTTGVTVQCSEWNGTSWVDLAETDGTNGLAKSGQVTFSSTVSTSKTKYLEGAIYYWYLWSCPVGTATIYHVALNVPWQGIVDIWDGVPRQCISFQVVRNGEPDDYTLEVATGSNDLYPIGAKLGGVGVSDYVVATFSDRQHAIAFGMLSGNTVAVTSGTTRGQTVYYWDGSAWTLPTHQYDGTSGLTGTTPLGKSEVLTWQPPSSGNEFPQTLYGTYGYAYKIMYGGTLGTPDEDSVIIDTVYGLPASLDIPNFKFPAFYQNRVFLCGYLKGGEPHRVDFSAPNAPDVWNGTNTSDNGRNSLYIGQGDELTASSTLFNRYGSELYSVQLFFTRGKTYVMQGDDSDKWRIFLVSPTVGCPAPVTVTNIEVGYEMLSEEVLRNVIMWASSTGPMMFDGSVLKPITGIEAYFDPSDSLYVGESAIEEAFAWYDSAKREWNLRLGDYWLAYDLTRRKWFEKETGSARLPMCAFDVQSAVGSRYVYAGLDSGYMVRLEYGNDWDGTAISRVIETGNFFSDEDGWNQTFLRRIKFAWKGMVEDRPLYVSHFGDDATSGTSLFTIPLKRDDEGRVYRYTQSVNQKAWLHRLKFETQTSETSKGSQPIGWGYQFKILREDEQ